MFFKTFVNQRNFILMGVSLLLNTKILGKGFDPFNSALNFHFLRLIFITIGIIQP